MRIRRGVVGALVSALVVPVLAMAQNIGAGPLTAPLADTEPTIGVLRLGPVRLAPGLTVREIGWDSNVFDEAENPKSDFVMAATPDVGAFARTRLFQVSGYAGLELNYYNDYNSERSIGHALRGRVDVLLARIRPFIGAGQIHTRTRPNGEVDVRADRREDELSGGLAYDLSDFSVIYGSAYRMSTEYRDAFEENVDLAIALTRDTYDYSGGFRSALTPLLTMTASGGYQEDRFVDEPSRNSDSRVGSLTFGFAPDAIVEGSVTLGFRDFKPSNPGVKPYFGFTGSGAISYRFLKIARVSVQAARRLDTPSMKPKRTTSRTRSI